MLLPWWMDWVIPTAYEFPPDAAPGDVRLMDLQEIRALDDKSFSLDHVVAVACVLVRVPKLPLSAIERVLELADLLATFGVSTSVEQTSTELLETAYLELCLPRLKELPLPPGIAIEPTCVELMLACTSREHGAQAGDGGEALESPYSGSHTWSEVAVVKHFKDNAANTAEPRAVATRNALHDSSSRYHVKRFLDPRGLIQHITLGDRVRLILRSQSPDWANWASFARLCVRFKLSVCEAAPLY